jgi:hypothetical protein
MWINVIIIIATLVYCRWSNEQKIGTIDTLWGAGKNSSQQWFDIFTAIHFTAGMLFEKLLSGIYKPDYAFVSFVVVVCIFEAVENKKGVVKLWNDSSYKGDSIINVFTDIVAAILGYIFAKRLPFNMGIGLAICFMITIALVKPFLYKTTPIKKEKD